MTGASDRTGRRAPAQRTAVVAAIVVTGAALWSRLAGLDQSLWHDEAHSALRYFTTGPDAILGGFYVPNNHVLFSLLTWATTRLLGAGEVVLRLWSVVPALAGVAVAGAWSWRRLGPLAGLTAAVLLVASPLHLLLSRMARGYGLALLATTVLAVAAVDLLTGTGRTRSSRGAVAVAVVAGTWTLPVVALPAGIVLAVLLARRRWPRPLVSLPAIAVVAGLPYLHRLGDVVAQAGQDLGLTPGWWAPLAGWFTDLVQPTFVPTEGVGNRVAGALDGGAWALVAAVVAVPVAVLGVVWLERRATGAGWVLAAPVLGTYLVVTALRVDTADRFVSPLLPFVVLVLAAGVVGAWELLRPRSLAVAGAAAVGVAATVAAAAVWATTSLAVIGKPLEDLRGAARAADAAVASGGTVLTTSRSPTGYEHYLAAPLRAVTAEEVAAVVCGGTGRVVIIVPHRGATGPVPRDCLRARGATRQQFTSRPERGERIDVWTAPAR